MEEEVLLIASSSVDAGIGCWDLQTGAERLRYKSCVSPPNGLTCVGPNLIASSQTREPRAVSGSILYWSWSKPQVEVKSFPEEPINPLVANSEGTFLFGGGVSGNIYLWEVRTGKLLRKWRAHYRAVTCLVLNEDESLLISGSEDGAVKVWSLFVIFDDEAREQISYLHVHNFSEHMEGVNDIVSGYGGSNAIIISASKDRTCKVWSLSRGIMLRSISFPSEIVAVALDPGEHVFYAGGVDGKIYIAALHADCSSTKTQWFHVIGSLSSHSKITCLEFGVYGNLLLAGSFDGSIRAWDPVKRTIVSVFKHAKGPVSNISVVRRPISLHSQTDVNVHSSRRHGSSLPPPLAKYVSSTDDVAVLNATVRLQDIECDSLCSSYMSSQVLEDQIKELQQQSSSAASGLEVQRLKIESSQSAQMLQKMMKMYERLHEVCVDEILDGENNGSINQHRQT